MAADKQKESKSPAKHPLMYAFSVFILLIIVVTFVGTPVASQMGGGATLIFGSYNGKDISYYPGNYLSRQKDNIAARAAEDGNDTNVQWVAYQVWKSAFQATAVHMAILEKAKNSGFDVSEARIDEALATYGPYIRDGKFDPDLYRQVSSREKMETRKLFKEDLIQGQVINDLQYGQRFSSREIEFIKEMGKTRRSFSIMAITPDSFPSDEVIAYGNEHTELFRKASFARITIKASADAARNVLDKLKEAPATFEDTAKTQSKDAYAEKGGLVGPQFYYSFKNEFEDESQARTVFSLAKDTLSDVIETPYGWIIYKCIEPASAPDWNDQQTVQVARSYIERYERGTIEDYLMELAAATKIEAAGVSFEAAADKAGFTRFDLNELTVNYGNIEIFPPVPEGEDNLLAGAAFSEDFFKELFVLENDEISNPVLVGENVILAKSLETTVLTEEELGIIDFYYPLIVQQYQQEELQRSILESELLEDNFDDIFSQYFLN